MLICYSFSTFTHVTCSLSVFTIFRLRWEVHLYSNLIHVILSISIIPPIIGLFLTNFGSLGGLIEFKGLFSFRSSLLTKSLLIFFPFATKIFQFAKFSFYHGFPVGDSSFIFSYSRLFVFFYVLFSNYPSHPSNTYIYFIENAHKETRTLKICLEGRRFTS